MKKLILALVVPMMCVVFLTGCKPSISPPPPLSEPKEIDLKARTDDKSFFTSDDPVWGDAKAPIAMVVFSDFQCPYCQKFAQELDQIEADWITTGKLKVQYRDFPLNMHKNSLSAHLAANAALRQGKYWEYHRRLYKDQATWEKLKDPGDYLLKVAQDLGLDIDKFVSDYKDPALTTEIIDDRDAGRVAGMEGTPAFLINGKLYQGALPIDQLIQELKAAAIPKS